VFLKLLPKVNDAIELIKEPGCFILKFCNLIDITSNYQAMRYPQLIFFVILTTACNIIDFEKGNGEIGSEKRMLSTFSEIQLVGNYEIRLKNGLKGQLVIVTDNNLFEYIQSEVINDVLIIESTKKIHSKDGIKLYITYQQLAVLKSTGASILKTENTIVSDIFELEVPGAGIIDLEVDVNDLEITLAGAGMVKLRGQANNQNISLNGVGSYKAFDLKSNSCTINVRGMGGAEINVKENLNAYVNGVGSIKYRGNPHTVEDKVSGIGTIYADEKDDATDQSKTI